MKGKTSAVAVYDRTEFDTEWKKTKSGRRRSLVEKTKGRVLKKTTSLCAKDVTGFGTKEGILSKENRRGKYQKRYFVLHNAYLKYYNSKRDYKKEVCAPAAILDLRLVDHICVLTRNGIPGKKIAIQATVETDTINENEAFFLKCTSAEEAAAWAKAMIERRAYYSSKEKFDLASIGPGDPELESILGDFVDVESNLTLKQNDSAMYDSDGFVTGSEDEEWDDFEDEGDDECSERKNRDEDNIVSEQETSEKNARCYNPLSEHDEYLLDETCWREADFGELRVRSGSYLKDKKKVPATKALFELVAVDNIRTNNRVDHIAAQKSNRVARALASGRRLPFMFVVSIQIPGPPFYSFVMYFAASPELEHILRHDGDEPEPGFAKLAREFFLGDDDDFRDERFKLIPRIVEGPFVVRTTVPSKPALLGKKIKQRYYRTPHYLELDMDIGSSIIARRVVSLCLGFARFIQVDLAIVLEGRDFVELPEQLLGTTRVLNVDFKNSFVHLAEHAHDQPEE